MWPHQLESNRSKLDITFRPHDDDFTFFLCERNVFVKQSCFIEKKRSIREWQSHISCTFLLALPILCVRFYHFSLYQHPIQSYTIYLLFSCCRKLPKEKELTHDMIWLFCAVSINHILDKRSRFPWQSRSTLLQIHHRSFKALIETGIIRLFPPNQENFHFIVFGFRIFVTFCGRHLPHFCCVLTFLFLLSKYRIKWGWI